MKNMLLRRPIAYVERVPMEIEPHDMVVEIERHGLVGPHRSKVPARSFSLQSEDLCEKRPEES